MKFMGIGDEAENRIDGQIQATRELGWKPRHPKLEQIISDAWRWHQAHPDGYPD